MALDPRRIEAKKLSLEQGLTQAAIAQRLGVSQRTVERWASEDGWGARKKAQAKVISINEAKSQPSQPPPASTHNNPPSVRPRRQRGEVDELEIVEDAIENLATLLGCSGMSDGSDRPIDTRGIGGIAGALVKLLEYRRKIQPPTAAELAEQAIAMGVSPDQFMQALRDAWRLRA